MTVDKSYLIETLRSGELFCKFRDRLPILNPAFKQDETISDGPVSIESAWSKDRWLVRMGLIRRMNTFQLRFFGRFNFSSRSSFPFSSIPLSSIPLSSVTLFSVIQLCVAKTPLFLVLSLFALLFAACGVGSAGASNGDLMASTQQIAQAYATSGDLAQAQQSLAALDVANLNQWLVYAAESSISNPETAPEAIASLIQLADALGLQSPTLTNYATTHQIALSSGQASVQTQDAQTQNTQTQAVSETQSLALQPAAAEVIPTETPTAVTTSALTTTAPSDTQVISPSTNAAVDSSLVATDTPVPTDTPLPDTPIATTVQKAQVQATGAVNLRGGPGTNYDILGAMQAGERAEILAKSPDGAWWQISMANGQQGWVFGQLVQTAGATEQIAIASNIPLAPTPIPTQPLPTQPPPTLPPPTQPPAATLPPPQPVAVQQPAAPATLPPPPETTPPQPVAPPVVSGNPSFRVVERRLWGVEENGGFLAGESVNCGGKRQLVVTVVDANGAPLNGVAVQARYGAGEVMTTGDKGEGKTEFILGGGQDVKVLRNADGRDADSEWATGLSTVSDAIAFSDYIQAGYCKNDESCRAFVGSNGCTGHYSWSVKFQRNY